MHNFCQLQTNEDVAKKVKSDIEDSFNITETRPIAQQQPPPGNSEDNQIKKDDLSLPKAYYDHSKMGLPVIHLVLG